MENDVAKTNSGETEDCQMTEVPAEEKEQTTAVREDSAAKTEESTSEVPVQKPESRKRRRIYEYVPGQDIAYRGPLSYRAFLIMGWICIVLSQVAVVLSLAYKADPEGNSSYGPLSSLFFDLADMSVPLILIANFAKILNSQSNYFRYVAQYGLLSAAVILMSELIYYRYILGSITLLIHDREFNDLAINIVIAMFSKKGFLSYNIFIDLFMCTLFMLCLNHRPKHVFTGNRVYILRALSIIPVLYEVASVVIQISAVTRGFFVPVWMYPLLTTKPPMMFLAFLFLALYIKRRELIFRKNGRTHEQYMDFLTTRRNSFHFSSYTAILFAAIGILDLIVMAFGAAIIAGGQAERQPFSYGVELMNRCGFGEATVMFILAPLMMLLSYTRKPRYRVIELLVPYIALVCIVLVYMEASYQFLLMNASFFEKIGDAISGFVQFIINGLSGSAP